MKIADAILLAALTAMLYATSATFLFRVHVPVIRLPPAAEPSLPILTEQQKREWAGIEGYKIIPAAEPSLLRDMKAHPRSFSIDPH